MGEGGRVVDEGREKEGGEREFLRFKSKGKAVGANSRGERGRDEKFGFGSVWGGNICLRSRDRL